MTQPLLTDKEDIIRQMVALYSRAHGPAPDRYVAIAEWLRLHAKLSANPSECLLYAENQEKLAAHMKDNPCLYAGRVAGKTDWQIYQEKAGS